MNIGGETRPVKFGLNQSILYCELRNINITQMNDEIAAFGSGSYTGGEFRDLLWSALKDGARVEKQDFNHSNFDVGDWMEEMSTEEMTTFLEEMAKTLPKPEKELKSKKKVPTGK